MNEWCFRPHCKGILGRGQTGITRLIFCMYHALGAGSITVDLQSGTVLRLPSMYLVEP